MNEAEWLACRDPRPMLAFREYNASRRKLRLFNCGCCRHVWGQLLADSTRDAVEVTERIADGLAELDELNQMWPRSDEERRERLRWLLTRDVYLLTRHGGDVCPLSQEISWETSGLGVRRKERHFQASLLRCLFGNPFRPAAVDLAWLRWRDGLVVRLAQAAYQERRLPAGTLDKDRLAVLADALEEAGCEDVQILGHLRSGGDHVRGCWAVDLLLSKS
jgi:hypothetical protein